MKTKITYGEITAAADGGAPEGFFARVNFPTLARLNERTGDGRLIRGDGFGVRPLPLSIAMQTLTGPGHDNSVNVGRLDEVSVEGNNVAGVGWLLDTPEGHAAYNGIRTKAYRGNSVDLAEVDVAVNPNFEADYEELGDDGKPTGFMHIGQMFVDFLSSKIAATTLVMTPAFAEAASTVEEEAEITASGGWTVGVYEDPEITASARALTESDEIKIPAERFQIPEADEPTPVTVDEFGVVYGHLGQWGECHTGVADRCVIIPHTKNAYASFLKKNVLTTEGLVPTGPVMLYGGHPATGVLRPDNVASVYGGTENAWADVTITDGRFGPWISGTVRPTATPEMVYTARASGMSGHWLNGDLYAIVSVNAEGYNVPRQFSDRGDFAELIASADVCDCNTDEENLSDAEAAWVALQLEFLLEDVDGDENVETEA